MILVAGSTGGATISEIVGANRRVAAMVRNPVDELCTSLQIGDVPISDLQVAITQLADQEKAGRPFLLHIRDLYRTPCPRCRQTGTAEWFAWDRESGHPFAKRVLCAHCDESVEGPVTDQDITVAGRFPATQGPAYHLALSRAEKQSARHDPRVAQLIQLYTSRNLAVLMDIVSRIPRLRTQPDVSRAMAGLLLEAFDQGSSLTGYGAQDEKPRSLRPPQRFLERNVWMILESATGACAEAGTGTTVQGLRHDTLSSLLARPQPGYLLLNRSIQGLDPETLAEAFQALIVVLTPPDAAFWALSALWAIWLWGDQVPAGLRGFLTRRRLDWEWYQRGLAVALNHARPMLTPGAPILMLTASSNTSAARAAVYAANGSGLEIERWAVYPPYGYRLLARLGSKGQHPDEVPETMVPPAPQSVVEQLLRQRGEPTDVGALTTAAIFHTRDVDFPHLENHAHRATGADFITETQLWLRSAERIAPPLADRVEDALLQHLAQKSMWPRRDLTRELYGAFNSICTPAPELVDGIIDAYTVPDPADCLSMRPEDDPRRRRSEIQELRSDMQRLGHQLGFRVVKRLNRDLVWRDEKRIAYLFRFSATAILGPHLLKPQPDCDGQRCFVTPGGRAALIALKLRRDPRLQALAEEHHWTFIKFRHLRRM
ncbi:MAG: hypothetical protein MUQ30_14315, partial [Anaerolineae bacterium]|nr:hypothetical protein [Anaerolineae bacterium]